MAGYSRLAALFGNHHDLAIFRSFAELNAKSLLYASGELTHLEAELNMIAHENRHSDDLQKVGFEYSVSKLMGPHASTDGLEHWAKVLEIREKLKQYNEALFRFHKICAFEQANRSDLANLQAWLVHKDGGNCFLKGREAYMWDKSNEKDLVSMTQRYQDKDILWKWIDLYVIPFFHRTLGHRLKSPEKLREEDSSETVIPLCYYSDRTTNTVIDILSTILAALLPTVPAFILYFLRSPTARLGGIVGFTFLFSVVLKVITRAKQVEVFAVATAFSAVLIVFVGNNSNANLTS